MTVRHAAYIVTLDEDLREDVAEQTVLTAIRMIKGVRSAVPVEASYEQVIARQRRDREWGDALVSLARNGPP
jgi:hypothetical protein